MAQVTVYVPDKLWAEYQGLRKEALRSSEAMDEESTSRLFQMTLAEWIETVGKPALKTEQDKIGG